MSILYCCSGEGVPKTSGIFSELLISDLKTGTQTRRHASNHQQCCIQGKGPCNRHSGTIIIRNPATSAFCFRSSIITNPMNTIDLMILHCATVFSKQCGSRVSSPQYLESPKIYSNQLYGNQTIWKLPGSKEPQHRRQFFCLADKSENIFWQFALDVSATVEPAILQTLE